MKKIPVTQERNQNTGKVAIISIIEDDAGSGFLGFFLTIILNKFWQSHISGWWMTDINGILAYYFGESNGTPLQYSCLENPWTEEPGRLQSMGSLRVRHD